MDHFVKLARRIGLACIDLLYPPHCYICDTPLTTHRFICDKCLGAIEQLQPPFCERCGRPISRSGGLCSRCSVGDQQFFMARSYGWYQAGTPLAKAIQGLKYEGERALAKDLASLLTRPPVQELLQMGESITYVPQSATKLRERTFNHAQLLARHLSHYTGLPVISTLRKTTTTEPQADLGRDERLENLTGAFELKQPPPAAPVVLVDDVFTTGATVRECSKVLKRGGAGKVLVVTLARSG